MTAAIRRARPVPATKTGPAVALDEGLHGLQAASSGGLTR